MDKVKKLPEAAIPAVIEASKIYGNAVERIALRVQYIIQFCVKAVGGKFEWWDWQNSDPGSRADGDFMESYSEDSITIVGEWTHREEMVIITKDGGEWGLDYGEIPIRWLYEDFEEEYTNGLKLYKEKKKQDAAKKKEKRQEKERERMALVAAAATKLTKEEKKALGIK